ncbi:response regulator [Dokdonella sp.]|uniref:response regulator n=1 Tax=Dokdonella sp. TaxID=2291710 RepID=UPI0031CAAB4C|nr:response regulator [Dokdonella sp.]
MSALERLRNLFLAARGERDRREQPRVGARAGTRVLIVDDSPTIVALLGKLLRQNGFQTLEAGNAEDGLALARGHRPDLIFLDIVLPAMNGFAALRLLRHDPRTVDIPVIMISGNAQATEQFYAQRIGADAFMKKPFSREDVFKNIESLLDDEKSPRRRAAMLRFAG